jgi:hypothetical protein
MAAAARVEGSQQKSDDTQDADHDRERQPPCSRLRATPTSTEPGGVA